MHPDCIHNQSDLVQRKKRREFPISLHVDAHGATKIELKCRQALPAFAAPPPADRCRPVDGLRTRTSNADNADP
jgi:hypothetical protein